MHLTDKGLYAIIVPNKESQGQDMKNQTPL